MINKRLFGTPIKGDIRKELEYRQGTNRKDRVDVEPGEPIYDPELKSYVLPTVTVTGDGRKDFRLDERTPFVRMWVGVKIIEPSALIDFKKEDVELDSAFNMQRGDEPYFDNSNIFGQIGNFFVGVADTVVTAAVNLLDSGTEGGFFDKTRTRELKQQYPGMAVVPIKEDGEIVGYSIKKPREQIDYARKIYTIGNHAYQEGYGQVDVNESLNIYTDENPYTEDGDWQSIGEDPQAARAQMQEAFPQELRNNQLLKPQSGITSISSETEGSMGLIKKTEVKFIVHNFEDFDRIYSRYFLKPGAQVFIDFGWSDIPYLYQPEELLDFQKYNLGGVQEFLYGEPDRGQVEGFITKNQGNVETLFGIVTDYSSKILRNGSVECSMTVNSSNDALLSFGLDRKRVTRLKAMLERGMVYLGLRQIADETAAKYSENEFWGYTDIDQLTYSPNQDNSAKEIETYEKNLKALAMKELSGRSGPGAQSTRTGIFVDGYDAEEVYISWGLFEDLIINSEFGFGSTQAEIEQGRGIEVKIDSSNSFTRWHKQLVDRGNVLLSTPEDPPVFLFPEMWGDFDNPTKNFPEESDSSWLFNFFNLNSVGRMIKDLAGGSSGFGSYNYQKKKFPESGYIDEEKIQYQEDVERKRIPIRECFIHVGTIVKAFEEAETVRKALLEIVEKINEDSDGFFGWKVVLGDNDAQMKIIDEAFALGDDLMKKVVDDNPWFTFEIMNDKSMVKDYDLEFKLPKGSLGDMYAIQGMSHGNSLFAVAPEVSDLAKLVGTDEQFMSIIYEPDMGSLRLDELLQQHNDSDSEYIYETMENIISSNTYSVRTTTRAEMIPGDDALYEAELEPEEEEEPETEEDKEKVSNDLIKKNDEILELKGFIVADSFRNFYKFTMEKDNSENKAVLLPYTLSLTMYGVSSIVNGDTFKVDYLPKMYLDTTYLQTTKVVHAIGNDGWFTTLETQFRTTPGVGSEVQNIDRTKLRISPTVFNKVEFHEENLKGIFEPKPSGGAMELLNDMWNANWLFSMMSWWTAQDFAIEDCTPYMTDCKVISTPGALDYVIDFVVTPKMEFYTENFIKCVHNRFGCHGNFYSTGQAAAAIRKHKAKFIITDPFPKGIGGLNVAIMQDMVWATLSSMSATDTYIATEEDLYNNETECILTLYPWMGFFRITPPPVYFVSGQNMIMMVKGDAFAFAYGHMKDPMIAFFDEFYGEFDLHEKALQKWLDMMF